MAPGPTRARRSYHETQKCVPLSSSGLYRSALVEVNRIDTARGAQPLSPRDMRQKPSTQTVGMGASEQIYVMRSKLPRAMSSILTALNSDIPVEVKSSDTL